MTDTELWEQIRLGDKAAFEELYHRYYSPLFAYSIRLCFSEDNIKDCIQDVFVRIYTKHSSLPELLYVKPYLYRSVTNALLNSVKNIRNNTVSLEELTDISIEDDGVMSLFEKNDAELQLSQNLKQAFEQLSTKQRHALYLRFIQEFSWDELAQMFEISPHSCMNLVERAIVRLRRILNKC